MNSLDALILARRFAAYKTRRAPIDAEQIAEPLAFFIDGVYHYSLHCPDDIKAICDPRTASHQ